MTQFEQENDLGRGGGEVDDDDLAEAWEDRDAALRDDAGPASPAADDEAERGS
jgi:hypothetical protein